MRANSELIKMFFVGSLAMQYLEHKLTTELLAGKLYTPMQINVFSLKKKTTLLILVDREKITC